MSFCRFLLPVAILLTISIPARAVPNPLRQVSGLVQPMPTIAIRVKTAKVVVADYQLIRRDFPHLALWTDRDIDQWLLEKTAFIARTQKALGARRHIQSRIETGTETIKAYRPKLYGRGLVYDVGIGLIDVKGAGGRSPRMKGHQTGLLELEVAKYEYAMEKLIHAIFENANRFDTIESYAVIDLGFKNHARWAPGSAGLLLRQGHTREMGNWICFETSRSLPIELLLRKYGITSVGNTDHIDIQGAIANGINPDAVVDFGTMSFSSHFYEPLKDFIPNWTFERILLSPDSPDFVQPRFNVSWRNRSTKGFFGLEGLRTQAGGSNPSEMDQLIKKAVLAESVTWND